MTPLALFDQPSDPPRKRRRLISDTGPSQDRIGSVYALPENRRYGLVMGARQGDRGQLAERRPIDCGKAS